MAMQTNWLVSIWYEYLQKGFSKQAIEIRILISIIPRNIFKLHAKKTRTKYDKICICEIKTKGRLSAQKEVLN